jgi:hypothetical protein
MRLPHVFKKGANPDNTTFSYQGEDVHNVDSGIPDNKGLRGIPVGIFPGFTDGMNTSHAVVVALPGATSAQGDPSPVTFARYNMSRGVHDVQLNNGWQRTNYGLRTTYASSGYLNEIQPIIPGQSRLYGAYGPPQPFVPRSAAPSQWQNLVNQAQSQPKTPGGPGQLMGSLGYIGQSGG